MVSRVLLEPAPAMTGTLPAAASTATRTTRARSSTVRVTASPVVPMGINPEVPLSS